MSDPHSQEFDVAIIGGGPAGAAAAFTAARAGLSTVVIDKAKFPRDKLCGGLFSGRARTHFNAVFGEDIDGPIFRPTSDVEFWFRNERIGAMRNVPLLFLTMRWDLDSAMLKRALAAGAVDLTGRRVQHLDLKGHEITLQDGQKLGFKVLIGADGVNSLVARTLFGQAYRRDKIGFAMEVEATGRHLNPNTPVRIDFAAAQGGYGWSFPKQHSTSIGVGGPLHQNPDMKSHLAEYLDLFDIAPSEFAQKGHFIPCGDFRARPGKDDVLLCGDAAGLVDPVTGEGIAYALHSGQLAAQSAASALAAGTPHKAFDQYRVKLRGIHNALRMARMIRPVLFASLLEQTLANSFRASSTLKVMYMQVLGGETEYSDLFRAVAMRAPRLLMIAARASVTRPFRRQR